MKKIYLTLFLITSCILATLAQVPTCSLNPVYLAIPNSGIFPDSTTNLMGATVGAAYRQDITLKIPDDTSVGPLTFCFSRFELLNPTGVTNYGLPPGLSITGTPSNLKFPAGQNSCAVIYGTPTTLGSYTLQLEIMPYGTIKNPFGSCPSPINPNSGSQSPAGSALINYYVINVTDPAGIETYSKDQVGLSQNQPNPFSGKTAIKYYVEAEADATLIIYNSLGSIVYKTTDKTKIGENTFNLDASNWNTGIYIYSVKFKGSISTKRFIISAN